MKPPAERKLAAWRETQALDRRAHELIAAGVGVGEAYRRALAERDKMMPKRVDSHAE